MTNYRMEIIFNTDDIDEDKIEAMAQKISDVAVKKCFLVEYKNGILKISGTGKKDDFANIGTIISVLKKKDWFASSVFRWLFYDSENGVEDLAYRYHFKSAQ